MDMVSAPVASDKQGYPQTWILCLVEERRQ